MTHDLILVGTGFASTFFLHGWLPLARPDARILVLERGPHRTHGEQLADRDATQREARASYTNADPSKPWRFALGLGGGSQCWWACTPRHMPEDFELKTRYGVGEDWPVTYDDLEPYYCEVEEIMQISGHQDRTPFPMSRPYPLPPHRFAEPDEVLAKAWPDLFFHQPTARPSVSTGGRPACCANGVCHLCPIDSKFTVQNSMMAVYRDPRVELVTEAKVVGVETSGDVVTGVRYEKDGAEHVARADLVALGANAIFNPWILLRSGLDHPRLGRGLCEQRGVMIVADLATHAAGTGSTSICGHAYHYATGEHRRTRSAGIVETMNLPDIQDVRGRWRSRWMMKMLLEDFPRDDNRVEVDPLRPDKPKVVYHGPSDHLMRSAGDLRPWIERILEPLPTRGVEIADRLTGTESHALCTHPMGRDPATSVTDDLHVHHRLRNLLLLGGGSFPTAPPANPSLTISALALRSARLLQRSASR